MKQKVFIRRVRGENREEVPLNYWAYGLFEGTLEVGKAFFMWRLANPEGEKLGLFNTSAITKIEGKTFETLNSTYEIIYLGEEDYKQYI